MREKELKEIAAKYFGFTQTAKIPENLEVEVIYPESLEGNEEYAKKVKIKWENHIGSSSGVARITPLDVMHYLHMKYTKENYEKAVEILKGIAKLNNLPIVRIGDKYLLINSKHRR
jgi:hypothetical protein